MPGTTYGVGPSARVTNPKSLKTYRIQVNAPDHALDARAVATYQAPNDTGVWKGIAARGTEHRPRLDHREREERRLHLEPLHR